MRGEQEEGNRRKGGGRIETCMRLDRALHTSSIPSKDYGRPPKEVSVRRARERRKVRRAVLRKKGSKQRRNLQSCQVCNRSLERWSKTFQ